MTPLVARWSTVHEPVRHHPLVARVRRETPRDAARLVYAADSALSIEATLAEVRRAAGVEPLPAFARTVVLAVSEVQATAARFSGPTVVAWRTRALRELGGLLFAHIDDTAIRVDIAPSRRATDWAV